MSDPFVILFCGVISIVTVQTIMTILILNRIDKLERDLKNHLNQPASETNIVKAILDRAKPRVRE